ncbi:MAG: DinB family protein [Candidatus Rokubacteria bacterium]|nr:DinB family protein [Candidatus Rokubacteria bacterium]
MPVPAMEDVAKLSRDERLGRLARTADELAAAIAGQAEAVLARRPDAKNWAPKEVVCHLRDTEEFFLLRFQTIAAMDEPKFLPADPDRWAEERQYLRNDAAAALRAFRRRREESLAYLRGLAPEGWQRGGVHPTRGRMTVGDVVTLMVWHDANHLDQLERGLRGEP